MTRTKGGTCQDCGEWRAIHARGKCGTCYWRALNAAGHVYRRGHTRPAPEPQTEAPMTHETRAADAALSAWTVGADPAQVGALLTRPTPDLVGAATWAEAQAWVAAQAAPPPAAVQWAPKGRAA